MTEITTNAPGKVLVADEVLAVIAGTAALEVDGVAGLAGNFTGDIAEMLGRKNLAKGVSVSVNGEEVSATVGIVVKSGMKVQEVSLAAQQRIKNAIETMTGLTATDVNVSVSAVASEKQKSHA